jgi:hypothetical protein
MIHAWIGFFPTLSFFWKTQVVAVSKSNTLAIFKAFRSCDVWVIGLLTLIHLVCSAAFIHSLNRKRFFGALSVGAVFFGLLWMGLLLDSGSSPAQSLSEQALGLMGSLGLCLAYALFIFREFSLVFYAPLRSWYEPAPCLLPLYGLVCHEKGEPIFWNIQLHKLNLQGFSAQFQMASARSHFKLADVIWVTLQYQNKQVRCFAQVMHLVDQGFGAQFLFDPGRILDEQAELKTFLSFLHSLGLL